MRKIAITSLLLFMLPFAVRVSAQNNPPSNNAPESAKVPEPPAHYYRLELVVQEVGENDKPTNTRNYSCTVSTARNERDSVRVGSRVPIATGPIGSTDPRVNTQFQFQDIGVNFDVSDVHEVGSKLAMSLGAEITSMGDSTRIGGPNGTEVPVRHQNTWHTPILIPIGKSTVVFTSDDLDRKGGMQVVVTAMLLQ